MKKLKLHQSANLDVQIMDKPLIQLSFDSQNDKEMKLAREWLAPHVDIIAIGKSIIQRGQRGNSRDKDYGVRLIHELKDEFPDQQILVEIMTADDAERFYEAGANICTISGESGLQKIANIINVAKQHHAEVQVDLNNVTDKIRIAKESACLGATIIGLHSNFRTVVSCHEPFAYRQIITSQNQPLKISVDVDINQLSGQILARAGADILAVSAHAAISSSVSLAEVAGNLHTLTKRGVKPIVAGNRARLRFNTKESPR
jgi:3-keto-L-gulonate-6-phosphate decarboxylase